MNQQLTDDEWRLLGFFRCLSDLDKDQCLNTIGEKAVSRCCPNWSVWALLPAMHFGVSLERRGTSIWDPQSGESYFEQVREGLIALGDEPFEWLLGLSRWDKDYAIPAFMAGARSVSHKNGYYEPFNRDVTQALITEIRDALVRSCLRVSSRMAKTVDEAESQNITVPTDVNDWIEYTLTLDGEAICEQLGWDQPGEMDSDLLYHTQEKEDCLNEINELSVTDEKRLSPILSARLDLYCFLRYREKRHEMPPSTEELAEIGVLLDWIRKQSS